MLHCDDLDASGVDAVVDQVAVGHGDEAPCTRVL